MVSDYLRVGSAEGLLGEAVAITGSPKALLKLRGQIDRALKDEAYPFEEGVYLDVNGIEFEVVVKRAKRREDMGEPVSKPEKTPEKLPWGKKARDMTEDGRRAEDDG